MTDPYKNYKVFLCGLPGSGKSFAGRIAARMMDVAFADLDEAVEVAAGKSIAEIFEMDGEKEFRRMEGDALKGLIDDDMPGIIALGGGALESSAVRESIAGVNGVVIWMKVSPEIARERLEKSGLVGRHPLLQGREGTALMKALSDTLERRKKLYSESGKHVETDGLAPVEVASAIYRELKSK